MTNLTTGNETYQYLRSFPRQEDIEHNIALQLGTRVYDAGQSLNPPRHMDQCQPFTAFFMNDVLRQIVGIGAKQHIFSPDKQKMQVPIFMRAEDSSEVYARGFLDFQMTNDDTYILVPPTSLMLQIPGLMTVIKNEKFNIHACNKEFLNSLTPQDLVPMVSSVLRNTTGRLVEPSNVLWGENSETELLRTALKIPLAKDEDIEIQKGDGNGILSYIRKDSLGTELGRSDTNLGEEILNRTIENARANFNFGLLDLADPFLCNAGNILRNQIGYTKFVETED
jgi:hypothetical protein